MGAEPGRSSGSAVGEPAQPTRGFGPGSSPARPAWPDSPRPQDRLATGPESLPLECSFRFLQEAQSEPRTVDLHLDGGEGNPERARDLRIGHALEGAHQKGRAVDFR